VEERYPVYVASGLVNKITRPAGRRIICCARTAHRSRPGLTLSYWHPTIESESDQ